FVVGLNLSNQPLIPNTQKIKASIRRGGTFTSDPSRRRVFSAGNTDQSPIFQISPNIAAPSAGLIS
ncbi:hypothetical protein, partial [Sutterella wadsworthensis]|uniref:hypothetical protein n=1 Tax=Sutterella wadsworthensis TaxID=40545 RepID=UPI00307F9B18